ncbi:Brix domain-containing protein [Cantharellus anzutake]|uniref:Brix domain-containing protein n=1 Tax=Cantharellus anzutake TaxID=1750568 RepID=UPI001904C175|nr:Brix domain-containing protein [Cantharellus anzutake]KAF8337572.1 Brix domain-containing protein [Cantharellus anzutake]
MARRRKTKARPAASNDTPGGSSPQVPRTFVVKHGQVSTSITNLVHDMRSVMQPNTATRLKERSYNKLKDFLVMAPPLGVSHLLAFTLTSIAPHLHVIRCPSGPSVTFRVERYSLVRDLLNANIEARPIGQDFNTPPLLVLSSFPPPGPNTPAHIPLLVTTFQSLFPPLSPKTISLDSARRVVLISYNSDLGTIDFRHYLIKIRKTDPTQRFRSILYRTSDARNLGQERDLSEYVLRMLRKADGNAIAHSATQGSDSDEDEVQFDKTSRTRTKDGKHSIRLYEIGPRMELLLMKITEGYPGNDGTVLYHHFVQKTAEEAEALAASVAERQLLKKQRREEQERNVARKKLAKEMPTATGDGSDGEDGRATENENSDVDEDLSEDYGLNEDDDTGEPSTKVKVMRMNHCILEPKEFEYADKDDFFTVLSQLENFLCNSHFI